MIIEIRHNKQSGKRNIKEAFRVNRINQVIGNYLNNAGITKDVANYTPFDGFDVWQISGNLPELAAILKKYPTVKVQ